MEVFGEVKISNSPSGIRSLWRNADSRNGLGNLQDEPGAFCSTRK